MKRKMLFVLTALIAAVVACASCATTIHNAARYGDAADIKKAIAKGGRIESRTPDEGSYLERGCTPLILAALYKNGPAVRYLISRGANVNAVSKDKNTPLLAACLLDGKHKPDPAIVSLLLSRGANIQARDYWGKTPLHLAAFSGSLPCVKILVQRGAKINCLSNTLSPFSYPICDAMRYPEIIRYLESKGSIKYAKVRAILDVESEKSERRYREYKQGQRALEESNRKFNQETERNRNYQIQQYRGY